MSDSISTQSDDVPTHGQTEADLLDAVMRNSPIMDEVGVPLPEEDDREVDPTEADVDEVEDPISDEVDNEEYEEEVEGEDEEVADEDDGQAPSTQEADTYSLDDLDLDAQLSIKVDGEEIAVSFGDLVKGYSTEQSLSKKGRELGEARKALDEERAEKLKELETTAAASIQLLTGPEEAAAKRYHQFEQAIAKARADGDTYELNELKDKREQAQQQYWNIRNRRENLVKQVDQQKQVQQDKEWQSQIEHFTTTIPTLIPDFDETVATSIRDFAIEEGIEASILDTITDPSIVKFVDDYRRLKQGVKKGTAKRKTAPVKKALPTKKPASTKQKKATKESNVRNRAFSENASTDDHMAFLKQHASKTLNKI